MKLERLMIAMESAARADDLEALHKYSVDQTIVLRWLHLNGSMPEDQVVALLERRGLVKSFCDPEVQAMMQTKARRAEGIYGYIG
jgi:hypothetical protein